MDRNRAQEIMDSLAMINVKYHGIPVYLQGLNEDNETATIFPLDEMDHEQQVDLQGLFEEGP